MMNKQITSLLAWTMVVVISKVGRTSIDFRWVGTSWDKFDMFSILKHVGDGEHIMYHRYLSDWLYSPTTKSLEKHVHEG